MKNYNILLNNGTEKNLKDLIGVKGLILFAYPKANTPWCTQEVIEYQNNVAEFLAAGYHVAGISPDNVADQDEFSCQYNLYYPLICDVNHELVNELKIMDSDGKLIRSTFVLDTELNIIKEMKDVEAVEHIKEVLKFVITGK